MAFHHVAIATRDLEASHRFYSEAMGFELVQVDVIPFLEGGWARHLFYDTGNGELHRALGPARRRRRSATSTPRSRPASGCRTSSTTSRSARPTSTSSTRARTGSSPTATTSARIDHGWCTSIYANDPSGIMVEFCTTTTVLGEDATAKRRIALLAATAPDDVDARTRTSSSSKGYPRRPRRRLVALRSPPASNRRPRAAPPRCARRARDRRVADRAGRARELRHDVRHRHRLRRTRPRGARSSRVPRCAGPRSEVRRAVDQPDGHLVRLQASRAASVAGHGRASSARSRRRARAGARRAPRASRTRSRDRVVPSPRRAARTRRRRSPAITTSWSSAVGYAFDGATSGRIPPLRRAHHAADLVVGDGRLHECEHGFVDRDVDLLAPAAPRAAPAARRASRSTANSPAERVADRDAGPRRRAVGFTGRVADPAHRLADGTEAGLGRARARLPEARHVHEHDARVRRRRARRTSSPTARACRA